MDKLEEVDERRFKTKPLLSGNLFCDANVPFPPTFYYVLKRVLLGFLIEFLIKHFCDICVWFLGSRCYDSETPWILSVIMEVNAVMLEMRF